MSKVCKAIVRECVRCAKWLKHIITVLLVYKKGERVAFSKEVVPEKVVIMGNAPSLADIDIEAISSEGIDLVCVNWYPLKNSHFFELKPRYYCLIDPGFFVGSDEFTEMWEVLARVDWDMKIICPQGKKLPVENPHFEYVWINSNVNRSPYKPYYWYEKNLSNPGLQNVVLGALYYFVSIETPIIYLAGVEMSEFVHLFVDEANDIYLRVIHDYGVEVEKMSVLTNTQRGDMYLVLQFYQRMFEQFKEMSDYAKSKKVTIYNLTPTSYIDVYEKKQDYRKGGRESIG